MPRLVTPVLEPGVLGGATQPTLQTIDGLELRPFHVADASALVAAYADPTIQYWHHRSMTTEEAETWIDESHGRWRDDTDGEWAVVARGKLVGRVGLHEVHLAGGQASVSYWTVPSARGRGVSRSAADRIAAFALVDLGFWRLEIRHSTRNQGSCAVATGAGFEAEALIRACHLHADGWHDMHLHSRQRPS